MQIYKLFILHYTNEHLNNVKLVIFKPEDIFSILF